MEPNAMQQPYPWFEPVFDGSLEAPLDLQYDLPDYCPEIQKLLKCRVTPQVSSCVATQDGLQCEGICDVRVLYLDSKGSGLRSCQFTKEFSAVGKLKGSGDLAVTAAAASVSHLTCRASGARRIEIHAAVSLEALAVCQRTLELPTALEGEGLEVRSQTLEGYQAVNAVSHSFQVEDQIPFKNGKPPVDAILRWDAACRVSEVRVEEEQIRAAGAVEVSFLYLPAGEGGPETMSASLSFSQTIACNGAGEGCLCWLRAYPGECSIQPREDDMGENTSVSVTIKLTVLALLYKPCEVQLLEDAYSRLRPLNLRWEQGTFLRQAETVSQVCKKKVTMSLGGEEIRRVVDLWQEQSSVQAVMEQGSLSFRAKWNLCLLYENAQGKLCCAEKSCDASFPAEGVGVPGGKCRVWGRTDLWEYRIVDRNAVEVSTETEVSALVCREEERRFLTGAPSKENVPPYPKEHKLLVVYASQGESLWEIGKSHRASMEELRALNGLAEDALPDRRPIIICNR